MFVAGKSFRSRVIQLTPRSRDVQKSTKICRKTKDKSKPGVCACGAGNGNRAGQGRVAWVR